MFDKLFKDVEIDRLFGVAGKKKPATRKSRRPDPEPDFTLDARDALRVPILSAEVERFEQRPVKPVSPKMAPTPDEIHYDRGIDFEPAIPPEAIPVLTEQAMVASGRPRVAVYGSEARYIHGIGQQLAHACDQVEIVECTTDRLATLLQDASVVAWVVRLSEAEEDFEVMDALEAIEHPHVLYVMEEVFDASALEKCKQFLETARKSGPRPGKPYPADEKKPVESAA